MNIYTSVSADIIYPSLNKSIHSNYGSEIFIIAEEDTMSSTSYSTSSSSLTTMCIKKYYQIIISKIRKKM